MMMGPASAMIRALGCTTVLGPEQQCRHGIIVKASVRFTLPTKNILPMVTSPLISLSTQTTAPVAILTLKIKWTKKLAI